MKNLWKRFLRADELVQMLALGNLIAASGFLILTFGFFTGLMDWPLGWLLAWPFSNIYLILYGRQIDRILTQQSNQFRVFFLYVSRWLVLVFPLLISLVLWYYKYIFFNPIAVALNFILFRIGIYFLPRKDDEDGQH